MAADIEPACRSSRCGRSRSSGLASRAELAAEHVQRPLGPGRRVSAVVPQHGRLRVRGCRLLARGHAFRSQGKQDCMSVAKCGITCLRISLLERFQQHWDRWRVLCACRGLQPSLPWRGRRRRPSAAVLSAKNADAKHRLCAEASEAQRRRRGGVTIRNTRLRFALPHPARLRCASLASAGNPAPPGEGGAEFVAPLMHHRAVVPQQI